MTKENKLATHLIHSESLGKRMVQGAGIAFAVISIFLLGAGEPNPSWGRFWMIKPLIIVPLAGALGGSFYYCMDQLRYQGRSARIMANFLGFIVYIFGLWLGIVLGFGRHSVGLFSHCGFPAEILNKIIKRINL